MCDRDSIKFKTAMEERQARERVRGTSVQSRARHHLSGDCKMSSYITQVPYGFTYTYRWPEPASPQNKPGPITYKGTALLTPAPSGLRTAGRYDL